MIQPQSLFPLQTAPATVEQELARKKFRRLTQLARQEGIVPPSKADLSGNEEGSLDINVVLHGKDFILDWGMDNWDDEREGVVVGVSLTFGEDTLQVAWSAEGGWQAHVRTTGESTTSSQVLALAQAFNIKAITGRYQQLIQQEAEVYAERMFRHYLANRPRS